MIFKLKGRQRTVILFTAATIIPETPAGQGEQAITGNRGKRV